MKTLGRSLFFGFLLSIQPLTIRAQTDDACAERERVVATLIDSWAELPVAAGRSPTQVVEFWLNTSTGTWSLVITDAGGWSCIHAAGDEGLRIAEHPVLMPNAATVGGGW